MEGTVYSPFSNLITKITVYETKETLHVVGSDEFEEHFRVLEISRNDRKELVILDDHKIYNLETVRDYLDKVRNTERKKLRTSRNPLTKVASGYILAGFVRFTEGYYLILVTSRQKVALIGSHIVYKVEGTHMIYVPGDKTTKQHNPDESRYVRLFENVDFSDNFYFSFTYDLTHTLQYNQQPLELNVDLSPSSPHIETRQKPDWRFVWNEYLLEPCQDKIHSDWVVYLIHGYLSQLNLVVFGKHIYLTVIARRSNKYAGPRFLKRGSNPKGNVANEVETEQIVYDASQTSLDGASFTSYVQLRGSIPLYWAHDLSRISKPPIILNFTDPYGSVSGAHFSDLMCRYGAPVIVLSLVKRRERRKRESILWDELAHSIGYLNQFLVEQHKIRYVAFDMARSNKKKGSNVLEHLEDISERCIEKTGIYIKNCRGSPDSEQHGVIRTNCVDCLDRTNTAQFAVGKHALGHQLHALGVISSIELEFDTDCLRMLESLYEDQGDTIALQYGGSNLVHRVQSYRKTDMLSAHSNDILQTLSRYYSNSFSDTEKQQAFNVFLGVYRPEEENTALWDLPTDHYLHRKHLAKKQNYCEWLPPDVTECLPYAYNIHNKGIELVERNCDRVSLNCFDSVYRTHELTSFDALFSFNMPNSIRNYMPKSVSLEFSMYSAGPFEIRKAVRWRHFLNRAASTSSRLRNFMNTTEASTFTQSTMPEFMSSHNTYASFLSMKSEVGNSVFHTGSTTEDTDSSSSEESDIECKLDSDEEVMEIINTTLQGYVSFNDILDDPYRVYNIDLDTVNKASTKVYKHYEKFFEQSMNLEDQHGEKPEPLMMLACKSMFRRESVVEVIPPTVKKETKKLYTQCVMVGQHGAKTISKTNDRMYKAYLRELKIH